MGKVWRENDTPLETAIKLIVLGGIVMTITVMMFIVRQPCDGIDNETMWCRVHPMGFFDLIGALLFYASSVLVSGLTKIRFWNAVGSVGWNLIWFAAMAAAFLMMYFL